MSLREKLINKAVERRFESVTFLGETLLCKLNTVKDLELLKEIEEDDDKLLDFVSRQFFDPETKKQLFELEDLKNSLSSKDMKQLVSLFFKTNGADLSVEEMEKN